MTYKCTNGFITKKGKRFSYGEKISSSDYNLLPYFEQSYFTLYEEDDSKSNDHNINSSFIDSSFDSNQSNDNSSDSGFSGFDSGDGGGAGASGDW